MNGLAVCAGIGGIELGLTLALPGYRAVDYVEREAYAAAVLAARMEDGCLAPAAVWDDLATFAGRDFRGLVDIVSAGIPCQPFSVAGKRLGLADERWLWPALARIVKEVRPAFVFLENVPGIARHGLGEILRDLAACGFDAEWDCFTAAEEGYPHLRKRLFLLAGHPLRAGGFQSAAPSPGEGEGGWLGDGGSQVTPDTHGAGLATQGAKRTSEAQSWVDRRWRPIAADPDCEQAQGPPEPRPQCRVWCAQSGVCVLDDGVPNRVDRLAALGNAVVPAVAARAWRELMARLKEAG